MTTHEFYHKYSIPHKRLMCADLPRVDYDAGKKRITKKEMRIAKEKNAEIGRRFEKMLKEKKETEQNKSD